MNAKLTKEQWMQIGNKAGWLKTAQTQPSGMLGFLPPTKEQLAKDEREEEIRKREWPIYVAKHRQEWEEAKKRTKKFPNALRSEEYSSLQSIIAVQDFAKVSQLLSRMDRVEKSELIKQLEETCRAFRSLIDTIEDKPYEPPIYSPQTKIY